MVQYGIAWYSMVLHGIAWYSMVLHGTVWYCMVQHGIAWYRCLISIMHFCLIDWTMSYSWKGLWLWMVGWVSVNSSERAASPLLAPLSVVSCLPPPAPQCCRRPCVPLLAPSFSFSLLPLAWQWSPTRAPGGRRWRRRWGSSQGGCAVGSRTMLWLLRRYSQNQEWFKREKVERTFACRQTRGSKQLAQTKNGSIYSHRAWSKPSDTKKISRTSPTTKVFGWMEITLMMQMFWISKGKFWVKK